MWVNSLFIYAILIINLSTSVVVENEAQPIDHYSSASEELKKKNESELLPSHSSGSYQVIENVEDVPENKTPSGPIYPHYAIYKPLNLGNVNKVVKVNNTEGPDDTNENSNKLKSNKISILHIKAEFDNKPEVAPTKESTFNKVVKDFKNYVVSLKKGLYKGIHFIFNRKKENEEIDFEKPSLHDKFHIRFDETDEFNDDDDEFSDEFEDH